MVFIVFCLLRICCCSYCEVWRLFSLVCSCLCVICLVAVVCFVVWCLLFGVWYVVCGVFFGVRHVLFVVGYVSCARCLLVLFVFVGRSLCVVRRCFVCPVFCVCCLSFVCVVLLVADCWLYAVRCKEFVPFDVCCCLKYLWVEVDYCLLCGIYCVLFVAYWLLFLL